MLYPVLQMQPRTLRELLAPFAGDSTETMLQLCDRLIVPAAQIRTGAKLSVIEVYVRELAVTHALLLDAKSGFCPAVESLTIRESDLNKDEKAWWVAEKNNGGQTSLMMLGSPSCCE